MRRTSRNDKKLHTHFLVYQYGLLDGNNTRAYMDLGNEGGTGIHPSQGVLPPMRTPLMLVWIQKIFVHCSCTELQQ